MSLVCSDSRECGCSKTRWRSADPNVCVSRAVLTERDSPVRNVSGILNFCPLKSELMYDLCDPNKTEGTEYVSLCGEKQNRRVTHFCAFLYLYRKASFSVDRQNG